MNTELIKDRLCLPTAVMARLYSQLAWGPILPTSVPAVIVVQPKQEGTPTHPHKGIPPEHLAEDVADIPHT